MGSIIRRTKRDPKTGELKTLPTWWIRYCRNGKRYAESTRSTNRDDAVALLAMREAFNSKRHMDKAKQVARSILGKDRKQRKIYPKEATSIYILSDGSRLKIGIAADVQKRIAQIQTNHAVPISLVREFKQCCRVYARRVEQDVHVKLQHKRSHGEWFECSVRDAMNAIYTAKSEHPIMQCQCHRNDMFEAWLDKTSDTIEQFELEMS